MLSLYTKAANALHRHKGIAGAAAGVAVAVAAAVSVKTGNFTHFWG